eukprot:TRINITY_DN1978_c0_g1_i1.p1 TRINITY_DN1978_c0_g1~~TRINITY_DN1978_c0_g1_i1.p1  ORF type:complete len:945 (+),score=91.85 TRINITY_DN1978_c0_g1_i1:179-2836(+)
MGEDELQAVLDFPASPVGDALAHFVGYHYANMEGVTDRSLKASTSLLQSCDVSRHTKVAVEHALQLRGAAEIHGANAHNSSVRSTTQASSQHGEPTPPSRSRSSSARGRSPSKSSTASANTKEISSIFETAKAKIIADGGEYLLRFLRWDLSISMVPPKAAIILGWKCQPIEPCIGGMAKILHSLGVLAKEAAKGLFSYLQSLWKDVNPQAEANHSKNSSNVVVAGDSSVDSQRSKLFSVMSWRDPCTKHLRLKGTVTFGLSFFGNFAVQVGTVPLTLESWKPAAISCAQSMWEYLKPSKTKFERLYTQKQHCNPHTVGLCMIAQKAASCWDNIHRKFEQGGIVFGKDISDVRDLCRSFDGVKLRLQNHNGKVVCAAANASQDMVTELDFAAVCNGVLDRVLAEDAFKRDPESEEMAFSRCRKAFGCSLLVREDESSSLELVDSIAAERIERDIHIGLSHNDAAVMLKLLKSKLKDKSGSQNELSSDRSDLVLKSFFEHPLWEDRCFAKLDQAKIWRPHSKHHPFFLRFAEWIRVRDWSAPLLYEGIQTFEYNGECAKIPDFSTIASSSIRVKAAAAVVAKRRTIRLVANMLEGTMYAASNHGSVSFKSVSWGNEQTLSLEFSSVNNSLTGSGVAWKVKRCSGFRDSECTGRTMILRDFMYTTPDEKDAMALNQICKVASDLSALQRELKAIKLDEKAADLLQSDMKRFLATYGPWDNTKQAIVDPFEARDAANKDTKTSGSVAKVRELLRQKGWSIVRNVLDDSSSASQLLYAGETPTEDDIKQLAYDLRHPYEATFPNGGGVLVDQAFAILAGGTRIDLSVDSAPGESAGSKEDTLSDFGDILEKYRKLANEKHHSCSLVALRFIFDVIENPSAHVFLSSGYA